jgi:hypothetical protein
VGTPPGPIGGGGDGVEVFGLVVFLLFPDLLEAGGLPWWEDASAWPGPEVCGGPDAVEEVLLEVEVEVEGLLECFELVDGGGVVEVDCVEVVGGVGDVDVGVVVDDVVVGGGVEVAGGQDSEIDFTGTVRPREEMGAPGGSW